MKIPEYEYESRLPESEILSTLREMSEGKDKTAYLAYRSYATTQHRRRILDSPEKYKTLTQAMTLRARQLGGRVIRIAFTPYAVEFDYLAPSEIGYHRMNMALRRAMSDAYRNNFKGLGAPENRGYLWSSQTHTSTLESPLLEQPHEFITF